VLIALAIEHFGPGAGGAENLAWRVAHAPRALFERVVS
jgi:hypothetical protein